LNIASAVGEVVAGRLDDRVDAVPQIAQGVLADPPAMDVEDELGSALDEDDTGIDGAQARPPGER
jgi:hypothetical protein